jgi:hypothetical protein
MIGMSWYLSCCFYNLVDYFWYFIELLFAACFFSFSPASTTPKVAASGDDARSGAIVSPDLVDPSRETRTIPPDSSALGSGPEKIMTPGSRALGGTGASPTQQDVPTGEKKNASPQEGQGIGTTGVSTTSSTMVVHPVPKLMKRGKLPIKRVPL